MGPDVGVELSVSRWLRHLPKPLIVYSPGYLYYRPLSNPKSVNSAPPEGLEFHRVTHDNVGLIEEWKGRAHLRRLRGLLNRGHVGVFGMIGGKVVSQEWAVARLKRWSPACWHEHIDVGEILLNNLETHPEYRRLGIALHTRIALVDLLMRLYGGRTHRTCSMVRFRNSASQAFQSSLDSLLGKELHLFILLGHICVSWIWDLAQDPVRRVGKGRLAIRLKLPSFLYQLPLPRSQLSTGTTGRLID